ncbi:MAG: 4Fe-4S binding protein, partial [Armatimonadetes bacterium]|nr:4Fe-4S binding protein [Armatimonadota bacterium]
VPIQDLPPQTPPSGVRVKPDLPPPNVMVDMQAAAVLAGLGEIGWSGELLTPRFGPRQRCQMILTDAVLDPSPQLEQAVCDRCGQCAETCPLDAMSGEKLVTIGALSYTVANIEYGTCRACRNGARPNPSHPAGLPDRLGALCTRTCIHHLEQAGRVTNTFAAPFRQRAAWQMDVNGKPSLQPEV